jgi:serine/threonine protein kinase
LAAQTEHRYEILATLGRGGFGTVYRARFLGEGGFTKQVAIKILNDRMNEVEDVARRLRDEARMLGLLDHRAIVGVDRLIRVDQRWVIIMEYIHGIDLRVLISAGRIPPRHALEIIAEIASALAAALDGTGADGAPLCLVHRDVKPENIFLTPAGDVKVLDFGIARANFMHREAYTSDLRFGSPNYMSPERFDHTHNAPEESPTDMYSLGVVMYELLLGKSFGRTSPIASRHNRFLKERLANLRQARIPESIVDFNAELLAYVPAERPTPREVERRALELVTVSEGIPLRFWAKEVVPPLVREGSDVPVEMSRFLAEDATADYSNSNTLVLSGELFPHERGWSVDAKRLLGGVALFGIVALTAVGGGVVGSVLMAPAPIVSAEPDLAVVDPTPVEPVAKPEPEVAPPSPVVPIEPKAPPTRAARVVERKPKTVPANVDIGQPHGTIHVNGDADEVVLIGVGLRYRVPGRIPPGHYSVAAAFGGGALQAGDAVDVVDGGVVNILCDGLLQICAIH